MPFSSAFWCFEKIFSSRFFPSSVFPPLFPREETKEGQTCSKSSYSLSCVEQNRRCSKRRRQYHPTLRPTANRPIFPLQRRKRNNESFFLCDVFVLSRRRSRLNEEQTSTREREDCSSCCANARVGEEISARETRTLLLRLSVILKSCLSFRK